MEGEISQGWVAVVTSDTSLLTGARAGVRVSCISILKIWNTSQRQLDTTRSHCDKLELGPNGAKEIWYAKGFLGRTHGIQSTKDCCCTSTIHFNGIGMDECLWHPTLKSQLPMV